MISKRKVSTSLLIILLLSFYSTTSIYSSGLGAGEGYWFVTTSGKVDDNMVYVVSNIIYTGQHTAAVSIEIQFSEAMKADFSTDKYHALHNSNLLAWGPYKTFESAAREKRKKKGEVKNRYKVENFSFEYFADTTK